MQYQSSLLYVRRNLVFVFLVDYILTGVQSSSSDLALEII